MDSNGAQPLPPNAILPANTTHWTNSRQEIHAWLREQSPSLAELYEGAVCLLSDQRIPGRIRFLGHAVREIRNRLPGEASTRLDYAQEIGKLAQTWVTHDLPLDSLLSDAGSSSMNSHLPSLLPDIPIPNQLFAEIQLLLQKHSSIRLTNRERAIRLFARFVPEAEFAPETLKLLVDQWWKTTEWFMEKTHDSGQVDAACEESELQSRFEEFEFFLSTLSRDFYTNTDELDKILEETNA